MALSYVRCPFLRSTFAATAPRSAVAELGVVRRLCTFPVNRTKLLSFLVTACFVLSGCLSPNRSPESFYRVSRVSSSDFEEAFRTARELALNPMLNAEHEEIIWFRLHAYIRAAGDRRFASALSPESATTRWAVRQYLDIDLLAKNYPETYHLLRDYRLQHKA